MVIVGGLGQGGSLGKWEKRNARLTDKKNDGLKMFLKSGWI